MTAINIRGIVLDVDKAIARAAIPDVADAIEKVNGVEGVNITVTEIDIGTVGMDIAVEGEHIDYESLVHAIESTGAVVHSIDQLATGSKLVEWTRRRR